MSAASYLLIQQARILQTDGEFFLGDVLVRGGEIVQIAGDISPPEEIADGEIIDATGLTLLPGAIDPQVHFREPGLEYKEDLFTATCACVAGGVTSFLEMPNTRPITNTQAVLNDKGLARK